MCVQRLASVVFSSRESVIPVDGLQMRVTRVLDARGTLSEKILREEENTQSVLGR